MEEMQRAFNKTIIKLQNTSRIAEEQVSLHEGNTSKRSRSITESSCVCLSDSMSNSFFYFLFFFFTAFQDQRQTESIQVLQSQLENVTKLMLNLTATVSQLQREVTYLYLLHCLLLT